MAENSSRIDEGRERVEAQFNGATRATEMPSCLLPNELAMLYCPVCSQSLQSHRCKLICPQCGYFMSCADYY